MDDKKLKFLLKILPGKPTFSLLFMRKIFHTFLWGGCLFALAFFIISIYVDYKNDDPITKTSYINARDLDSPIKVKICNSVFVDLQKVLTYNGSDFNRDSYEFLFHTETDSYQFSDSNWVIRSFADKRYMLSSRFLTEFKLELNQFLILCAETPGMSTCSKLFYFTLDPSLPCYEAIVPTKELGKDNAFILWFYFDPNITVGRYTTSLGAYVTVTHAEEYKSIMDGIFVGPQDEFVISTTVQHFKQSQSFEKSRCYAFEGPQTYSFTGVPFQAPYNQDACDDLCYAETYYHFCNCAPLNG